MLVKEFDEFVAEAKASDPTNIPAGRRRIQRNREMDALVADGDAATRASKRVELPDRVLEQENDGDKTGEVSGTVSFAPEKARGS